MASTSAVLEMETLPSIPDVVHRASYVDAAIDFLGGVAGGSASVYVGQPLDTVKVKLQTFPTLYKNAMDCFMQTYRNEGIYRGLYAGTIPSLAAQISENSVLFMAYGMCQKGIMWFSGHKKVSDLSPIHNAMAGGLSAFFSSLTLCPTELIKCRLQAMKQMQTSGHVDHTLKLGPMSLTRMIIKEDGFKGLFRGFIPTLYREMPGYFFFFGGYEISRTLFTLDGKSKDDLGPWKTMTCGGIGGAALWIAIFPADVIKSRVQVARTAEGSFFRAFLDIAKNEGITALYKGLGPTLLRTFPATGALFLAYETVKKTLGNFADARNGSANS